MDSQRYLRCLGQPALFAATGEPIRFRTRKHLALLVYIAVENRALRRDRLAELLWPKVSVIEARHSLATALSILRPRLGIDALETSRDQVRLLPGNVGLDLERLEAGDVLGSDLSGPLEVAAFLEGFEINDSAEFTHWKDRQQARLLPIIKDALLVLIDRCRRMGDTRQIEKLADRMLALDDLSEEAIRAKMEARAFAGDRLTALEIFEAWKKKLAEELQAAPSAWWRAWRSGFVGGGGSGPRWRTSPTYQPTNGAVGRLLDVPRSIACCMSCGRECGRASRDMRLSWATRA
jgi:DNA-binding SARP family transcriptional activator